MAWFTFSSALYAQTPKTPTLDEILNRLEANLNNFDTRLPSIFCDEHVVSSQVQPGMRDLNTVTDSVFLLKRTPNPDHTVSLVESRENQRVDGKPATPQPTYVPTTLSGAFEGGLALVSRSQAACMSYSLQRSKKDGPGEPYVVRFATVLTPQNSADCFLQENSKGRALIDPTSFKITHVEFTTSHHVIIPGNPIHGAHHRQAGTQHRLCTRRARWRAFLAAFRDHHARGERLRNLSHDGVVVQGDLSQLPPAGSHVAHPAWQRDARTVTWIARDPGGNMKRERSRQLMIDDA